MIPSWKRPNRNRISSTFWPGPVQGHTNSRCRDSPEEARTAHPFPAVGTKPDQARTPFSLSWLDKEELGICVFVREQQGPQEAELWVYAEGLRPELLGKAVSVALFGDLEHR